MPRPPPRRLKILVMDDSDIVLEVTQDVLEEGGYDVVTISSSALLPKVLNDEKPDLALIDVSMPVVAGQSVVELMRRSDLHRCPLVLYSDRPALQLEALSYSCGASGYIRKTSDRSALLARVAEFLPASGPAEPADGEALRIFVVADPSAHAELERAVRSAGGEPACFESGDQCLAALEKVRPALIFMELEMSPVSGEACCRKLRENRAWADIPVVMLSRGAAAVEVMRAWRAGADDFVPQPVSAKVLASRISAVRRAAETNRSSGPERPRPILLAEHSAFFRVRLGRMLECSGYTLLYANSPEQTLAYATEFGPSLTAAIVDLELPGLEPLELLERVKQRVGAPILAVSEVDLERDLPRAAARLTGRPVVDKRLPCERAVHVLNTALYRHDGLRVSERVPFFSMVEFRSPDGEWTTGFSYDLSLGGIFVTTLAAPQTGTALDMKIAFPGWGTASCGGIVAWANGLAPRTTYSYMLGMGVKFVDPDHSIANLLQKYAALRTKAGEGA